MPDVTVAVSPSDAVILTADTLQLAATVRDASGTPIPGATVTWSTNAPAVATVLDDGRVIPHAAGFATITATSGGKSAASQLRVYVGTGTRMPGATSFDSIIPPLMAKYGIPGGVVGVVKDGRLVLVRGYGYADSTAHIPVSPDALFRIASVSKPITSAAVLKLVEQGKLRLDDKAFSLLSDLTPPAGATVDPRLADITVRHLLQHAGGWDHDRTFDPMFRSKAAADVVGAPAPASAETVIRYMLGQPLQFDPGTDYSYSNFGYDVLGRIIERVSGMSYGEFVRTQVLAPMGITRTRLGHTRLSERANGEVRYYDAAGPTLSVFPGEGTVPAPYGGFYLEAMDSHGGWLSTAADLLRFVNAVDGRASVPDFLSAPSIDAMTARPPAAVWQGSASWYGMGWVVRPSNGDADWWHDGSLPGTTTLLVRAHNGVSWVALFNARKDSGGCAFLCELYGALPQAVDGVQQWPTVDLFSRYP
ncbi:MAG: serine hydrolase [Longimicrobiaceae bacterium]